MSVPRRTHRRQSTGNTLLDRLLSLDGLDRHLEPVRLDMQEGLLVPGETVRRIFFPTTCVCSILIELKTGQRAEIGTVGNEGFVGIPAVLRMPATELAIVQIPGDAYAMKAPPFQNALERNRELYQAVVRYIGFAYQVAQQVNACNAYHTVDQRLARWLLVCADRARRLQFEMNQELLSHMVAATRPRVSEAARRLKLAGVIDYTRGNLEIRDRTRLERVACECYTATKRPG